MIYFIKKTVNERREVIIESQNFSSMEKCTSTIDEGKALVPNYIISSSMAAYDVSYDDATILIVKEGDLKVVVDIVIRGISGTSKSDDFVISTIKEIHKDKIKGTSDNKKTISSIDMTRLLDECRNKCLNACVSGIAADKKIVMEFFELKSTLGLNNQSNGEIQN
jgi:hypothetical protein